MATATEAIRADMFRIFRNMLARLHALFGWGFVVEDRRRCSCNVIWTDGGHPCKMPTKSISLFFFFIRVCPCTVSKRLKMAGEDSQVVLAKVEMVPYFPLLQMTS